MPGRTELVRESYRAFRDADREAIERLLSPDFSFHSPPDPDLDRAGYFERCWPHAGHTRSFELERVIESDDEVVVTYVATREDGSRFRNTEVHTLDGDRISRQEVYFGWDIG
jgi:ketosteroid isomerase-like protein